MPKHRNIHQKLISHIKIPKHDVNGFSSFTYYI